MIRVIAFLLVTCPAWALWTPQEIVELQKLSNGLHTFELAELTLADAINHCTIEGVTRPYIANAWHGLSLAHQDYYHGFAFLTSANPEEGTLGATIASWPRSQWVTSAWSQMDAGFGYQAYAATNITNALALAGLTTGCASDFNNIISQLAQAKVQLQSVDRTQPFANPFDSDYPQVIGPHGTRDDVLHLFYFATRFWDEMEDYAQGLYARVSEIYTPAGYYSLNRILMRHVDLARLVKAQWMHTALILMDQSECTVNAFHLVADKMGAALSHTSADHPGLQLGVPYALRNMTSDYHRQLYIESLTKSAQTQLDFDSLTVRSIIGWQYSDGAMWALLQFPNPAKLGLVSGQATAPGGIYGPPACP